jgi:lysozyme
LNIIDQLKKHEGFRGMPYKCTEGKLTVGYGTSLPLSKAEGEILLRMRLDAFYKELYTKLPWVEGLSQTRQNVLINMTYNLGIYGLLKFKKMLSALKKEEYGKAADEMLLSRWSSQVGHRAVSLSNDMRNG